MAKKKKVILLLILPLILGYGNRFIDSMFFAVINIAPILTLIFSVFWYKVGSYFGSQGGNKLKSFLLGNSIWAISFMMAIISNLVLPSSTEIPIYWGSLFSMFSSYAAFFEYLFPHLVGLMLNNPSFDGKAFADYLMMHQYIPSTISFISMIIVFTAGFVAGIIINNKKSGVTQ